MRPSRAAVLVAYLKGSEPPFVTIESVRLGDTLNRVSLSLNLSIPQAPVVPIRRAEPIEIRFPEGDGSPPEVYATRTDFPRGLIHTTPGVEGGPVRLCLWEAAWHDVRRSLSPQALIERIREWFERTADGTLHTHGQPLEPLLVDAGGTVVLPHDYRQRDGALRLSRSTTGPDGLIVLLDWADAPPAKTNHVACDIEVVRVTTHPHPHRALTHSPVTLGDLARLVSVLSADLQAQIRTWMNALSASRRAQDIEALILVDFVKSRTEGGAAEAVESWAFFVQGGIAALAQACGLAVATDPNGKQNYIVPVLGVQATTFDDTLPIVPLRVTQRLSRAQVRRLSGGDPEETPKIVAIGAGAVGSHVIENASRAAFGEWSVVDADVALPHNIPRFVEGDRAIGFGKAHAVAVAAGRRYAVSNIKRAIASVFQATGNDPALEEDIAAADLLLDLTASPATLGALADHASKARRASMFFGPSGRDAVLLLEDTARACRLDGLEAQYFGAVASTDVLADHLDAGRAGFVRYSNACNDISRPLHPANVVVLSGILTRALEHGIRSRGAAMKIWRLEDDGAVQLHAFEPNPVTMWQAGDWTVGISAACIAKMRSLRQARLPKETGGVLIGTLDLDRRVVHIVDALPAPPDSIEKRTSFVRGKRALTATLDRLGQLTHGNLRYLGEWHSHPEGAKTWPSTDDEDLFAILAGTMDPTFEPYFMLICGDRHVFARLGVGGQRAEHVLDTP